MYGILLLLICSLDSVLKKYPNKFVGCCLANPADDGCGLKHFEDLVLKVQWMICFYQISDFVRKHLKFSFLCVLGWLSCCSIQPIFVAVRGKGRQPLFFFTCLSVHAFMDQAEEEIYNIEPLSLLPYPSTLL